jgi:hypothetical protein
MRINFWAEGASCGVADIVSLQSQGKTSRDFGNRTERVRIVEIAYVSGKRIDFARGKNLAKHGPSIEKKIGGIAVVSFEELFESRQWSHDSGGIGVYRGCPGGSRVRGKSGANGSDSCIERAGKGFESWADGVVGVGGGFGGGGNFSEGVSTEVG